MNWLMIAGLVIVGIIVVAFAAGALFCGDLMSYTATGSQTLNPAGAPAGKALVVYNPGVTGAAKDTAATIAGDLQAKGYTVDLAGIRSQSAANVSGYNVVIVGGPMYFGSLSNSVNGYLKALKPQEDAKVGVFGATGSGQFNDNDIASVGKQVTSDLGHGTLEKMASVKTIRSGSYTSVDCTDLVSTVLQ